MEFKEATFTKEEMNIISAQLVKSGLRNGRNYS